MTEKPIDPLLIQLIKLFKPYQILIISALYISTIAYIFIVTISNQYYLSLGVEPAIFQYSVIDYFTNYYLFLSLFSIITLTILIISLFSTALIHDFISKFIRPFDWLKQHPKISFALLIILIAIYFILSKHYPIWSIILIPIILFITFYILNYKSNPIDNAPALSLFDKTFPFFLTILLLIFSVIFISAIGEAIAQNSAKNTKEQILSKSEKYKSRLIKIKESNQEVYKLGCGPELCAGLIAPNDPEGNIESIIFDVKSYSKTLPK